MAATNSGPATMFGYYGEFLLGRYVWGLYQEWRWLPACRLFSRDARISPSAGMLVVDQEAWRGDRAQLNLAVLYQGVSMACTSAP